MESITGKPAKIIRPGFKREDARGSLTELINSGSWKSILWGQMNANPVMGNHYHKLTKVVIFFFEGSANIICENVETHTRHEYMVSAGEGTVLEPGSAHALIFKSASSFVLLKSRQYSETDSDTYSYKVVDA